MDRAIVLVAARPEVNCEGEGGRSGVRRAALVWRRAVGNLIFVNVHVESVLCVGLGKLDIDRVTLKCGYGGPRFRKIPSVEIPY